VNEPRLVVTADPSALARAAADVVAELIAATPSANATVATGRTPVATYAELVSRRDAGTFDPSSLVVWQLDEYLGLEPGDRRALFGWMHDAFLEPLDIGEDRTMRLPTEGDDLPARCAAHDAALADAGGLDLALLGLGVNGHLGFNEPPSAADTPTRVVALTEETRAANASYWDGATVPTHAVTTGLRPILSARTVLVLASGPSKRAIVHRMLEGPVDPSVPASAIREAPGEVTVIVDRAAWDG
jgi:glucosamine-6-phosphate deaminase